MSIWDQKSPGYDAAAARSAEVRALYEGSYLPALGAGYATTFAGVGAVSAETERFVPRRSQAESRQEYAARVALLDPDMGFAYAMNSLAGQVGAVESGMLRQWQLGEEGSPALGLGDPEQGGTPAHRLMHDADGAGTSWPVLWRRATLDALLYQDVYALVVGVEEATDPDGTPVEVAPRVVLLPAEAVPYVHYSAGRPVVAHVRTERTSEGGRQEDVLTVYALDGWTRYVREQGSDEVGVIEESGTYGAEPYYMGADKVARCLPLVRLTLPLRQHVAHLLARKRVSHINMANRRDALVNKANTPRLVEKSDASAADGSTQPLGSKVAEDLVQGQAFHVIGQGDELLFIEPGTAGADLATRVLDEKDRTFQRVAYQAFESQAREVTATEVREQVRTGAGALLALLAGAVDRAEQRVMFLLCQAEGLAPEHWVAPKVERPTRFVAEDEKAQTDQTAERVFGDRPPPVGATARRAAAERYATARGLEYSPDEIEAEVAAMGREGQEPTRPRVLDRLRQSMTYSPDA